MHSTVSTALLRMLRFATLLLATLALVGCSNDETLDVATWTLVDPVGHATSVTAPGHWDALLPRESSHYQLRASVPLRDAWRGHPLALAIPYFLGRAQLRANGVDAFALDPSREGTYRSLGPQAFRIPEVATHAATLDLVLEVDHTFQRSAWMESVPRLSANEHGDAAYTRARDFNRLGVHMMFGAIACLPLVYLLLYILDRRRSDMLWFVRLSFGVLPYGLFLDGSLARIGRWELPLALVFLATGPIASVRYLTAHFGWKPVPALLRIGLPIASGVTLIAFGRPFVASSYAAPILMGLCGLSVMYSMVNLTRELRRDHDRFAAIAFFVAWAMFVILPQDILWGLGLPDVGPYRCLGWSVTFYGVVQALVLGREHARSLDTADRLNVELAGKLTAIEQHNRDVVLLNDELRRQIGARSRELADGLAHGVGLPTSAKPLSVGDSLADRYRVIEELGRGGMGVVWAGERISDGRRVAIKELSAAARGPALARFAREAQIAAEISHPNLVSVLDVELSPTTGLHIVMERVEGRSLVDCTERFGDVAFARPVLLGIARGLAALHARGIVHRDLKPANILLANESTNVTAKIADFGIARLGDGDSGDATSDPLGATVAASADPALTGTGVLMGTPLYMAPELARGSKDAKPSSDVFSFGVLAYELLAKRRPFAAPPALVVLAGKSITPPSPLVVPELPARIATLIHRCIAIDPALRPTAAEVAMMLGDDTGSGPKSEAATVEVP